MPTVPSSRVLLLAITIVVFTAITVNANWGSGFGSNGDPTSEPTRAQNSHVDLPQSDLGGSAPTLGNYPATTVSLADNITITPDAPPTNTTSITAQTTTDFFGQLTADPVTGIVRVTNAHQANIAPGNYTVTVKAFGINGVTASRTFVLTVTSGTACNQDVLFSMPAVPWVNLPINPGSLAIGDFNNDGIQDVIAADHWSGNASIRLGNGSGGFTLPAIPEVAIGTAPWSVAIGDFNGDGNQDIAAPNYFSNGVFLNNVSIRLGDGNGGFTLPPIAEIVVGSGPFEVSVGDFNGDGKDDLAVVSNSNGNVSIRMGNGDGGFSLPSVPELAFPGGVGSVAIGDFNNDGFQDLAVTNSSSPSASYVSIRLGDGSGGFTSPSTPEVPVGWFPGGLAIGDFNADGNQDFATANSEWDSISIRLGNGSGGFTSPAVPEIAVGNAPNFIEIGDFNNDGIQDLALWYYLSNKVSIRLGDGSGGFTSPTIPEVVFGDNFFYVHAVAIGDLNGDGIQDLAAATSNSVSIRLGNCGAAPTFSIGGTVTYGNTIGSPEPRFVSNVVISSSGSSNSSTTTAPPGPAEGQYTLNGFGTGSYTVTPSKTTGQNSITSFDAAKVALHVAGISELSGNQHTVADISGDGILSSFDAGQIARYAASSPPFGNAGNWLFTPINRTYSSVTANITGQDYEALLMGEVSGNWTNSSARPARANGSVRAMAVTIPRLVTQTNKEFLIPIHVQGAANNDIIAYEFDLRYDPSVIQPQRTAVDLSGTVSRGLTAVANLEEPGLLRVAVYGAMPITQNGVLLNLRFIPVGVSGSVSPLTWERIMFNEGEPRVSVTDGRIELY